MEQKVFDGIKRAVADNTLLSYPYFNKCFDIHMDDRHYHLEAVFGQEVKPIAFYSHKPTGRQTQYTVMENKLLSIVKTLKGFHTILLGHKLKIFKDHKNLTCKTVNNNSVLLWRLIIVLYGPARAEYFWTTFSPL